jgi:hypothetical protein
VCYPRTMRFALAMCSLSLLVSTSAHAARVYKPPAPPPPPPPVEPSPAPSAEPAARERVKLLVLDLKANDVEPTTVKTIQGIVTARLAEYAELEVISGEDMRNLVQLEAERQSMGSCSEEASCMAELADALGAELVVFGSVGALDTARVLNLNLFDSKSAMGLGRIVVQVENVNQMPRKLRPKLHDLLGKYYAKNNLTLPPLPPEEPEPAAAVASAPFDPGPWPWVAAGVGGVLVAAGAAGAVVGYLPLATFNQRRADVLTLESQFNDDGKVSRIETARKAQTEMLAARDAWNTWGVIAFDGGIAAAATGLLLVVGGVTVGLLSGGEEEAPTTTSGVKPPPKPAGTAAPAVPATEGGAP